jgi:hypothetical protein
MKLNYLDQYDRILDEKIPLVISKANRTSDILIAKLKTACWICGIKEKDLKKGKKHIKKIESKNRIAFVFTEMNLTLAVVEFTNKYVYIKRIRVFQYWAHKVKNLRSRILYKYHNGNPNRQSLLEG